MRRAPLWASEPGEAPPGLHCAAASGSSRIGRVRASGASGVDVSKPGPSGRWLVPDTGAVRSPMSQTREPKSPEGTSKPPALGRGCALPQGSTSRHLLQRGWTWRTLLRSQTQKDTSCVIPLTGGPQRNQIRRQRADESSSSQGLRLNPSAKFLLPREVTCPQAPLHLLMTEGRQELCRAFAAFRESETISESTFYLKKHENWEVITRNSSQTCHYSSNSVTHNFPRGHRGQCWAFIPFPICVYGDMCPFSCI
ncbi:uncharacterized protein LOC107196553 [Pteropus alecto]|uniref:uncharacterized protein LOC107196553 n=1 Tax=Pteropus alecto TaxID=9402 RepID=UPI0007686C51|nr:uncharacterized protein LOC107196553 [Pteropus alecto]